MPSDLSAVIDENIVAILRTKMMGVPCTAQFISDMLSFVIDDEKWRQTQDTDRIFLTKESLQRLLKNSDIIEFNKKSRGAVQDEINQSKKKLETFYQINYKKVMKSYTKESV